MNVYTDKYNGRTVVRITKREARRLFGEGKRIYVTPVNCSLDNPYYCFTMYCEKSDDVPDFDNWVSRYENYYCVGYSGRYAAYYV